MIVLGVVEMGVEGGGDDLFDCDTKFGNGTTVLIENTAQTVSRCVQPCTILPIWLEHVE